MQPAEPFCGLLSLHVNTWRPRGARARRQAARHKAQSTARTVPEVPTDTRGHPAPPGSSRECPTKSAPEAGSEADDSWRWRGDSNPRMTVLQTVA